MAPRTTSTETGSLERRPGRRNEEAGNERSIDGRTEQLVTERLANGALMQRGVKQAGELASNVQPEPAMSIRSAQTIGSIPDRADWSERENFRRGIP